jgi:hypothetical protein
MNISNRIKNLEKIDVIDKSDIFLFDHLPIETINIYENFYKFFYHLLDKYSDKNKLEQIHFYIDNRRFCSASAGFSKGTYLMKISCAYPIMILDKFNRLSILENPNLISKYKSLTNESKFKANNFLAKCSMTFTFHHEFRHLIQCDGKEFDFSENTLKGFDFDKHLHEFDADRIGSRMVMDYVFDIYEQLDNKTEQNLKDLFFLALGSIVITFLLHYFKVMDDKDNITFTEIDTSFYVEEKTHPHTLVRLANIIEFYSENIQENYNLNISIVDFLKYPFEIANLYFSELFGQNSKLPNVIYQFFEQFDNNLDDINMYNGKLFDGVIKHVTLSKIVEENNVL